MDLSYASETFGLTSKLFKNIKMYLGTSMVPGDISHCDILLVPTAQARIGEPILGCPEVVNFNKLLNLMVLII